MTPQEPLPPLTDDQVHTVAALLKMGRAGAEPVDPTPCDFTAPKSMTRFTEYGRPCSVDGCERRSSARGWCHMHYERWRRHGDPLHVRKRPQPSAAEIGAEMREALVNLVRVVAR